NGAPTAPAGEQLAVEPVQVGSGEPAHIRGPDQRHELADDRAVADHRRHLEAPLGVRQPRVEQLGDRVHDTPPVGTDVEEATPRPYSDPVTPTRASHGLSRAADPRGPGPTGNSSATQVD